MAEYAVSPEIARVVLVAGVILSMLFYERAQLTTGGAIVPAYFALSANRPVAIAVTIFVGYLTYLIVHYVVGRRKILYGRKKFEVEVLVGLGLILVTTALARAFGHLDPWLAGLAGIGFLIPGILAHDMGRQKPGRTIFAVAVTAAALVVVTQLLTRLLDVVPGQTEPEPVLASVLGYPREVLIIAVGLSVVIGTFVFSRLGIRSGGFISGAYLALVSPRWPDMFFTATVAIATWFVVTRLLMPRLLLFGRRKLSTMILVGALIGWSLEIVLSVLTHQQYQPWRGLTVATLMVPALIANDAQRQGWERTVWGTGLTAVGVLAATNAVAAAALAGGLL
ncbi:hypothetical protein HJ588_14795 [Flexivirga sp. ID2601S]|uniref:Poly-gamma-glutamate biosynthesis protein PgsC n=1 Tax=Flexivirga aerilata TaxID=1656889 RepID=A0A849AKG7_9MICO|nr:poly-gamma-glutamate biosynthesis protein PgsC/CapC [Flexivirga aerilata]NNG40533.1 hypothetical protein [Flexivirga aerilata]